MPPVIPPPLAAYIQSCLSANNQILITSVLNTPSAWLSLRLVFAALRGVEDHDARGRPHDARATTTDNDEGASRGIIILSLFRPLSLWVEMGKKLGLDIASSLRSRRIVYIDGLASASAPVSGQTGGAAEASSLPTTRLNSLDLADLRDAMNAALKTVSTSASPSTSVSSRGIPTSRGPSATASPSTTSESAKPLILLDGIDFLLASQPSLSVVSLHGFLSTLRAQHAHAVVVTCNADSPLLQGPTPPFTGTPLERNHEHFVTSMAHRSGWVLQLRGLDTGSAKDVSGVVRVSRGGDTLADEDEGLEKREGELMDAEWLYQLKADGSVRVWGRGE